MAPTRGRASSTNCAAETSREPSCCQENTLTRTDKCSAWATTCCRIWRPMWPTCAAWSTPRGHAETATWMPMMIKDRKIRICMIGAGDMAGNVHYPTLASRDDVEIVAVIETRANRLNTTCDRFGIAEAARFLVRLDTDYQKVVKDLVPDAVYAIGQPEIMYPIWHWCLTQGFNVYIEKP